jgi:hypothetical protein
MSNQPVVVEHWMTELWKLQEVVLIKSGTFSGACYGHFSDMGDEMILKVCTEWREANFNFETEWNKLTSAQKLTWHNFHSNKVLGKLKD